MKIVMHMIAELSPGEARKIIPLIQQVIGDAKLSVDNQIRMKFVEEGKGGNGFFDLPSKTDPQNIGERWDALPEWYRSEMLLSVRTSNALARAEIFPRELAEMTDRQILEIRDVGEIGRAKIRKGLDSYFCQ